MNLKQFLIPFFFGFIGIFAFSPFSIKPLIILSYSYLIRELVYRENSSLKKIIFWSFGHWGFGMSWLIVSVYYYGETSILISLIIFLLLILILTTFFSLPLSILRFRLFSRNNASQHIELLYISSIFILSELSRYYLLNGIPWLIPGSVFLDTNTQYIYSIFGVAAGSMLIYLFASLIALYWGRNKNISYIIFLSSLILFIPVTLEKIEDRRDIYVSIIQPSSDPFLKYKNGYKNEIEQNILNLVERTSPKSEIVVLPEAELPYSMQSKDFTNFIKKIDTSNKEFISGVWSYKDEHLYNALININTSESYNKMHLVPFGEYIPFISSLRGIISFFDMPMSNVKHGNKNQQNIAIFQDKTINFAPLICFDIAFSNTVRKSNKSSYFMINISNDTWFGKSIGPYHHLDITRVRAIENNKWIIRSTNDGFSAIITNNGTIVDIIEKGITGVINSGINIEKERSLYNIYGYFIPYLLSILIIVISAIMFKCRKIHS
ncbi:apolipoprotein N-acyltransferase [Gammaproteobacteria bacterium]|nr:apolipoprotein N-acyltransferase [Gammaproteobacteria bacterium]MDC0923597.1 apolipoprotein N-acyltransferase [Gammaproteobacteria bacterium]MDC3313586.1 apolipoprotein N-acyltransferase [Gammaproteobacteria bacterium]